MSPVVRMKCLTSFIVGWEIWCLHNISLCSVILEWTLLWKWLVRECFSHDFICRINNFGRFGNEQIKTNDDLNFNVTLKKILNVTLFFRLDKLLLESKKILLNLWNVLLWNYEKSSKKIKPSKPTYTYILLMLNILIEEVPYTHLTILTGLMRGSRRNGATKSIS